MSNTLAIGKKTFTWAVVVATIAWAMSAAFIAIPLTAQAATVTAGDLIRGTVKSPYGGYPVYYYGSDGKRHLFPTQSTYASWFGTDFSTVKVLTEAEVGAIPLGGNVFIRPGSRLIKEEGPDTKVYAVAKGGVRRHVSTEASAASLFGAEWSKGVVMIPTGFFSGYTDGSMISVAADYDKAAALASAPDVGTDMGLSATPVAATPTGALSAAMASDSPAAAVLPQSSTSTSVMKFTVTAGATAATISSASFRVVGVGASGDFNNVYLFEGGTRLTSGRTVASQTRTVEFSNLGLSVGANASRTITVVVDVSADATSGDTHAFELTSLGTTASVSGLPLRASTLSIGSQDVSTVTIQRGTDPSGPTIGQKNVAIAEFRLTAGTNDVEVRRITATVGGTVSMSDITMFELWQGSTKLGGGTVSSDRVVFDMSSAPYTIPQGANRMFTIKADVGGRGGRTITTYVDSTYPTDLLVVDKTYGYGALITFTSFGAAATASATPATGGSFVTTIGGRTTVAFNGPPAADVSRGVQDATLYKFSMSAGEQAVEVRRLGLTIAGSAGGFVRGSTGTRYFTDIKVKNMDTGAVVMGPKEHASANSAATTGATPCASSGTLCFTDTFTIDSGKTLNLVVTADTANAEDAAADEYFDEGYQVTLEAFGTSAVREVSTGQYLAVADIVGGGIAVQGNTMTVRTSSLTVAMASTPVSGSTVRGLQGVNMAGFSFTAGTSSAAKVTQVVLSGEGNDTSSAFGGDGTGSVDDLILSASLWEDATQVGTTKSPTSTGTITFDNLSWNIAAGTTKKLVVKVNLATTLMAGASDFVTLGLPIANVTSQDVDSNSITATMGTPDPANANGASNFLTVNSAGTLTVALDGDTALPSLAVSGAMNVPMLRAKFTAARESYLIKKVRVVNTSATTGTADSASADDMVGTVKLSYKKQDGTTATATGVLTNGIADVSGLEFYVGNDKTEVLAVNADIADLNVATGRTAVETPRFGLDFGITGDTNFEAVGIGSNTTLMLGTDVTAGTSFTNDTDAKDADVVGYEAYAVKSKPTVTLSSASPSGASLPGNNEVLRFTVAADASSDIELARITFKVNSTDVNGATTSDWNQPMDTDNTGAIDTCLVNSDCTDVALSAMDAPDFTIFDSLDQNTQLVGRWRLYDSTGAGLSNAEALGFARFDFTTARTIASGTTRTYIVKVDTTGAATGSTPDTFRLDIQEDTSATVTSGSATARGSSMLWGETGSNNVAVTAAAAGASGGITGFLVKNLPVVGGTLRY